jgi:hypothetical protein
MAGLNWKWEAAAGANLRFWQGIAERCRQEGLAAPEGAACPYVPTSFSARHWRRGHAQGRN